MSGTHKHKCSNCSHIWEHSNMCAGNKAAHTCAQCGAEEWFRYEKPEGVQHIPLNGKEESAKCLIIDLLEALDGGR